MWIKGNYRRIFLDMHIDDWHQDFLSKLDPPAIVATMKEAGAQSLVVKAKPHTGLCYWPSTLGRMHRGLKGRDYVGEMTRLCRENGIDAMVYYSQIFDNWAYDNHPAWRCVYADGQSSREKGHHFFRRERYGVVCPNNMAYRAYVKANLEELNRNYQFPAMFLDMPFWPEVCYCASCKERYFGETGREMPKIVDWQDEEWLRFQSSRERWMGEFVAFSTACIKGVNPHVTVEHNFAVAMFPWQFANSERVMDACDYAGGDYYGGYLQQTFACKYYRNVSPHLPFVYITSRCDPDLIQHTTTKTREAFLQHAATALVHNGAFSICDGMNPDGTIAHDVYRHTIREVFAQTRGCEPYVTGDLCSNAAIWFPSFAKFTWEGNGKHINEQKLDIAGFAQGMLDMAAVLRQGHIPFDVVAGKHLPGLKEAVLILSQVNRIADEEMEAIEAYMGRGGNVYLSGRPGHPRFWELLEAQFLGVTREQFSYMSPTPEGQPYMVGFDSANPIAVAEPQQLISLGGEAQVLATVTLPYTAPDSGIFASIHADPPGIHTDYPALVRKPVGKGCILWTSAAIEKSRPYTSRKTVQALVTSLIDRPFFTAKAPADMEIVMWSKGDKKYLAALNQREQEPLSTVHDVEITLPFPAKGVSLLPDHTPLPFRIKGNQTVIPLPGIGAYMMLEVALARV